MVIITDIVYNYTNLLNIRELLHCQIILLYTSAFKVAYIQYDTMCMYENICANYRGQKGSVGSGDIR